MPRARSRPSTSRPTPRTCCRASGSVHGPPQSLRAGALAVKHYAWYQVLHWRGGTNADGQCFDLRDDTVDQVYDPSKPTWTTAAAAVDATWSVRVLKNGKIFPTYYNAGGSGEACGANANGWRMYQWGTQACGLAGKTASQIVLTYYYPGVTVSGGADPTPSPTPSPTPQPTPRPTPRPTATPTPAPTAAPSSNGQPGPVRHPDAQPKPSHTPAPTPAPTPVATPTPDAGPGVGHPATVPAAAGWRPVRDRRCRHAAASAARRPGAGREPPGASTSRSARLRPASRDRSAWRACWPGRIRMQRRSARCGRPIGWSTCRRPNASPADPQMAAFGALWRSTVHDLMERLLQQFAWERTGVVGFARLGARR